MGSKNGFDPQRQCQGIDCFPFVSSPEQHLLRNLGKGWWRADHLWIQFAAEGVSQGLEEGKKNTGTDRRFWPLLQDFFSKRCFSANKRFLIHEYQYRYNNHHLLNDAFAAANEVAIFQETVPAKALACVDQLLLRSSQANLVAISLTHGVTW